MSLRSGMRWLEELVKNEHWTLSFYFFCAVLTFVPCMVPRDNNLFWGVTSDHVNSIYASNRVYIASISIIPGVVLPQFIDALMEIVMQRAHDKSRHETTSIAVADYDADVKITRLTDVERLMFAVGSAIQPAIVLTCALHVGAGDLQGLINASLNFKIIMVMAPMLSFLQRCTTTFTPLRSFAFMFVGCMAFIVATLSDTFFVLGTPEHIRCTSASRYIAYIAVALFFGLVGKAAWAFFADRRQQLQEETHDMTEPSAGRGKEDEDEVMKKIRDIDFFYTNYVPAAHMVSCILLIISFVFEQGIALFSVTDPRQGILLSSCNFIFLVVVSIVVLVENRVRHNEVERTLLRTISSVKKSYVRYLSHELRTPLNTTWLGIQLLVNETMQASKDVVADERLEILNSMSAACKGAVDILEDLIQFDKLESGILTLKRQPVDVGAFVSDAASVFAAKARQAGVQIKASLNVLPSVMKRLPSLYAANLLPEGVAAGEAAAVYSSGPVVGTVTSLIRETDVIEGDKQKLDSVLSTIIDVVLKGNASGGQMAVAAWFLPHVEVDVDDDTKSSWKSAFTPRSDHNSSRTPRKTARSGGGGGGSLRLAMGSAAPSGNPASRHGSFSSLRSTHASPVRVHVDGDAPHDDAYHPKPRLAANLVRRASSAVGHVFGRSEPIKHVDYPAMDGVRGRLIIVVANVDDVDTATRAPLSVSESEPVEHEIQHFNPRKLVAGGGDEMSLWISRGVISLHGGSLRMFSDAPEHGHAADAARLHRAEKKAFVVELPMMRPVDAVAGGVPAGHNNTANLPRISEGNDTSSLLQTSGKLSRQLSTEAVVALQRSSSLFTSWTGVLRRDSPGPSPRQPAASAERKSTDRNSARHSFRNLTFSRRQSQPPEPQTRVAMPQLQVGDIVAAAAGGGGGGGNDGSGDSGDGVNVPSAKAYKAMTTATEMLTARGHAVIAPDAAKAGAVQELVLVVDDSDLTRKMLCRIMKAQGYDYEEADDGDVAVEMVRKNMGRADGRTYAVILMDFIMPVMDGPTATKHIRELGFTAPVLGVTGNGQDFDVAHFVASGANKVFTKPLDVQGFRAYMKAVKDKQAADKQAADERR